MNEDALLILAELMIKINRQKAECEKPSIKAVAEISSEKLREFLRNSFMVIQPDRDRIGFYLASFARSAMVQSKITKNCNVNDFCQLLVDIVEKYNPIAIFIDRSGAGDIFYERIKNYSIPVIPIDYSRLII